MIAPNAMLAWRALMDKIAKSQAGKFVGGAADMLLPDRASDLLTGPAYAIQHPLDSMQLLGRGMQDASQNQFEKMYAAPTTSEAIGHGLAGAIPMVGPVAAMTGEEIGAGNTARGMGMATALLAPSLYHGAVKPVMADVNLLRRAANIDAIRRANKVGFNLSADQAAGGRSALANMTEPAATSGREGSLSQLYGNAPVGAQPFIDSPLYPEGTLGNVRPELKATPSANYDPLKGLPSRRDALKVGGAAAIATAMIPRLLEGMGKAPEAAAAIDAPVLGRAAPSALGREGFYRELKNRVYDGLPGTFDDRPTGRVLSDIENLPANVRDGRMSEVPDLSVSWQPGDRFFLSRSEFDTPIGPQYIKQVNKVQPHENLRAALRDFNKHQRNEAAYNTYDHEAGASFNAKRTVHSEITPEAAMRLNTIEKPKVPLFTYGNKMGTGEHDHLFKLVDDSGNARAVGAIPPTAKDPNRMNSRDFARFERETMQRLSDRYGDHYEMYGKKGLKLTDTDWDIVPIEKDEFNNIGDFNDTHGQAGLLSNEVGRRPNTVGISPRYTKRVSIRLLKDTMAKQIAENKRAAGKGIPPLLAKPAVLQDNPALTRFDFLRGIKKP